MVDANQPAPIDLPDSGVRNGREPRLHKYFRAMTAQGASDLHFKSGCVPHIRLKGRMLPVRGEPLSQDDLMSMVEEVLDERQRRIFADTGGVDLAQEIEGADRFRINVFRQRGQISVAVRRVSRRIPSFAELHLPPSISKVAEFHAGLVLVAGITGSGKSTSIAAMIEHINVTRACHVVTIEDPIEYLYTDKKAMINQREIGIDVPDFDMALKYLMRQDPDVVLIGEMRDLETFQAALTAAETGHLVFGTIHASGAASTIGRILDLFPPDAREQARQAIAFNLRAIICQRLLESIRPGVDRVPAVEILLMNPSARQMLAEGRDAELNEVIRSSTMEGMMDFTQSLLDLIKNEFIDPRTAYEAAPNADELRMRMKGISSSHTGLTSR